MRLGPGWGDFGKVGIGDSNGDGWADLFAIGGAMSVYIGRGLGRFATPDVIGPGWGTYARHTAADADADIWATNGAGVSGQRVDRVPAPTSMDVNGDSRADIGPVVSGGRRTPSCGPRRWRTCRLSGWPVPTPGRWP